MDSATSTTFTDGDLVKIAQNAARVAAEDATALAKGRIQHAIRDQTSRTLSQILMLKIDPRTTSRRARLDATRQRIIKGNLLYSELTRLCTIGKDIYSEAIL